MAPPDYDFETYAYYGVPPCMDLFPADGGIKNVSVKTCFVHKYAWAGRLWQDGVLGPASLVIVGRWRREAVKLSTVRTNYHKV